MSEEDHYLKKELLARLQNDPNIFRFIDEACLDGMWFLNSENFEDEWYSPQFKRLFGYEEHEIPCVSSWWQDHIHPEDLQLAVDSYNAHAANPDGHPYDQIVRYRHKDGSTVWVRCRGLILFDEDGKPKRMLGAHTNVTALKKAEEERAAKVQELETLSVELRQSNQELEQFAYLASHDLQEPLRMVATFAKMIDEVYGDTTRPLDERGRQWLAYMCEGATRMQKLINSLLSLSRIKPSPQEMGMVEMEDVIGEIVTDYAIRIHESNAKVLTGNLPPVYGIHSHVRQVFQNLISNGMKFSGDDYPVIRIRGERKDGMVEYSVQDEGIGIPSSELGRITEAFYRGKGARDVSGSGIGLSICEKIMNLHGGTLRCESEVGKGTTFYVTFKDTPS